MKLGKAALLEKEELNAKWGQILGAARAEREDLEARSAALRGRCAVLKERRGRLQQEVDRGRAQLFAAKADDGRCACVWASVCVSVFFLLFVSPITFPKPRGFWPTKVCVCV